MPYIEYRLRPVTRYVVTRFERDKNESCSAQKGEFDNAETAYAVAYALAKEEHDRLGYPPGDERIQYPAPIGSGTTNPVFQTTPDDPQSVRNRPGY